MSGANTLPRIAVRRSTEKFKGEVMEGLLDLRKKKEKHFSKGGWILRNPREMGRQSGKGGRKELLRDRES